MPSSTAQWSIIREPDDGIAKTRISLGQPPDFDGGYIVFRGDPADVVLLLEAATEMARRRLPKGRYADKRGRPQG